VPYHLIVVRSWQFLAILGNAAIDAVADLYCMVATQSPDLVSDESKIDKNWKQALQYPAYGLMPRWCDPWGNKNSVLFVEVD
jgi:hypothetical protein